MKKPILIALALASVFAFVSPIGGPFVARAQINTTLIKINQLKDQVVRLQTILLNLTQQSDSATNTNLSSQISTSQANYQIEYKVPSYFSEYLKHPQHFFSGRDIKIVRKNGVSLRENELSNAKLSKRDKNTKLLAFSKNVDIKLSKNKEPFINLPLDTETGYYTLDFQSGGKQYLVPIEINGLTQTEKSLSVVNLGNRTVPPPDNSIFSIKRLNCGSCYWESVLGVNPNDENHGYFVGQPYTEKNFVQTKDGWQTSKAFNISQLTNPLLKNYAGDPKVAFTKDAKFTLSSILSNNNGIYTGGIYQDSTSGNYPAQLKQTDLIKILNNLANLGPNDWLLFDYEKMAIDTDPSSPYFRSIYIFAHHLWFDDPNEYGNHYEAGFFTIRNNVITQKKLGQSNVYPTPRSVAVGPGGIVYVVSNNFHNDIFVEDPIVFSSLDGGQSFTESVIAQEQSYSCSEAKTSILSNRAWNIYSGPESAVDKQGRLYVSWAKPKECISDSSFEWSQYGKDFDVFVSRSDDYGVTWSQPVKVNDDNSSGDQGFANIKVDDNGVVYVAFLDHRENQDKPQFDVYLTKSDNKGLSFSRNIKINDVSIPNVYGWRDPGDYLDMLAVGKTKIFVSHPCVNLNYPQNGRPSDACVATLTKNIFTITASAGTGGTITPAGVTIVSAGSSQTFTNTPWTGYQVGQVSVNGSPVGAVTSYTFSNVQSNQTIDATFRQSEPSRVISPNDSSIWPIGSIQNIRWHFPSQSPSARVQIELTQGLGLDSLILAENTPNDGSENVIVPANLRPGWSYLHLTFFDPGIDYQLDSQSFQITGTPSPIFSLISPPTPTTWTRGITQNVTFRVSPFYLYNQATMRVDLVKKSAPNAVVIRQEVTYQAGVPRNYTVSFSWLDIDALVNDTYLLKLSANGIDPTFSGDIMITAPAPASRIISTDPLSDSVMAQDASGPGFNTVNLTFSGSVVGIGVNDFSVLSSNASGAPGVASVLPGSPDTMVKLSLSRPLAAGERIRLTHNPSNSSICLGFLPGDANGDGFANSSDVSYLNGVINRTISLPPLYKVDINRDGVVNQSDINKVNEIISSTPITARRLSACPAATSFISPQNQTASVYLLRSLLSQLGRLLMNSKVAP